MTKFPVTFSTNFFQIIWRALQVKHVWNGRILTIVPNLVCSSQWQVTYLLHSNNFSSHILDRFHGFLNKTITNPDAAVLQNTSTNWTHKTTQISGSSLIVACLFTTPTSGSVFSLSLLPNTHVQLVTGAWNHSCETSASRLTARRTSNHAKKTRLK